MIDNTNSLTDRIGSRLISYKTSNYSLFYVSSTLHSLQLRLLSLYSSGYHWWVEYWHRLSPTNLYQLLLAPRSTIDDTRHREFMVNVLLCGLAIITSAKIILSLVTDLELGLNQDEDSLLLNGLCLLLILIIWRVSRRGGRQLAAYSLLGLLGFEAMRVTLSWSFELPVAELMYAAVIVTAGIILAARSALIVAGVISVLLLGISYGQVTGLLQPHTYWLQKHFRMSDAFGYIALLLVIALVTWLTNRDAGQSLARARTSEAELAYERDNLELLVIERTRDLLESQQQRNLELERFAEFGRVSAGLLHEVANPLTAATLNLETTDGNLLHATRNALKNLQQLERYVNAARMQLKQCCKPSNFGLTVEFKRIALLMGPQARQHGIQIIFDSSSDYRLYGDTVKFNQILANLLVNAIDAYGDVPLTQSQRVIEVSAKATSRYIQITVRDWGNGISQYAMNRLFDAFYTTKSDCQRGTGIGLTMVKRAVEEDFKGTISVTSSIDKGTIFVIKLRRGLNLVAS